MHSDRNYLAQYLDVIDAQTHEQLGYLCDISESGLMFATTLTIALDEIKDIYIQNNLPNDNDQKLSVKAKIHVLWERPNINPQVQCIGCNILEMPAEDHQRLSDLVTHLRFNADLDVHRTL